MAAVLFAVGALSGCGADAEAGGDEATGDEATGDNGLATVTISRSPGGQFQSTILADRLGYFEEAGLDVTIEVATGNASANLPLLLNDQLQFAMVDGATMIQAADSGVPVKLIAAIQSASADVTASSGLLVPPDSPIKSLEDVEGKTIGTSALGGTPQIVANMELEEAGVDLGAVEYVQLPVDSLQSSAESGQVDAILSFANFYAAALEDGFIALTPGMGVTLPGIPQVAWAASDEFLAEQPDVARAFVEAMDKAHTYAMEHLDEVRAIDHELTDLPADYLDNREIAPLASEIDVEALETLAGQMHGQGFTESAPAREEMVWSDARVK